MLGRVLNWRWLVLIASLAGILGTLTACGGTATAANQDPNSGTVTTHLYMTILTGGMIGKKGWPEFVPSDFTVPANSVVDVEIRDFDDGAATTIGNDNQVVGTVGGTVNVISDLNGNVSASTNSKTVSEVSADNVAHTFTFQGSNFNLNVPIPPLSTVEFSFKAPAAGTYNWQCNSACGTDPNGSGGPMVTDGWMQGVMTVK